jgi:heme exporter protein C
MDTRRMTTATAIAPPQRPVGTLLLLGLALALVLGALLLVARAPPDVTLGIVQKIFYFHVGSAFAMLLCLSAASVFSLVDLVAPTDRVDALARASLEIGLLFSLNVLTSGPLWARKSWGAWWTWEPRLTLTLLVMLIAAAVLALRQMSGSGMQGRRIGAAMAVLAGPTSYLIHIAVQKWGGTHPQVIQGGGIQSVEMKQAFWLAVFALLTLATTLIVVRFRGLRLEQQVATLRLELSARTLRQARRAKESGS